MASLFDYLDWRGDLTFDEAEFNEVDSLILAWLSYAALDGIVPSECSESDTITIEEATAQFLKTHDVKKILRETVSFTKTSVLLLQKLAISRRFRSLELTGFINNIDYKKETQFCAMTVLLQKNRYAVVFRGTDEHLISWKEDFNMSFLPVIPAQNLALSYLEETADRIRGRVYVCGHSKGGNLAVYSGVRASYRTRRKIIEIYNHDGPGFYDINGLGDAYEEMLRIMKQKNLVFHTGYMYRYNAEVMRVMDMVKNGDFGEIFSVETHMDCRHTPEKRQWLETFPGGMMFFLGCHLVDLIYGILGVPEELELVCFLPVGKAAEPATMPTKKTFEQRAWFNGFGGEADDKQNL